VIHFDINKEALADTLTEMCESVWLLFRQLRDWRGTTKIVGSPEATCLFETGCSSYDMTVFDPNQTLCKLKDVAGMEFWKDFSIKEIVYHIYRGDELSCKVYLKNFMI
jgi:hypothetical protein